MGQPQRQQIDHGKLRRQTERNLHQPTAAWRIPAQDPRHHHQAGDHHAELADALMLPCLDVQFIHLHQSPQQRRGHEAHMHEHQDHAGIHPFCLLTHPAHRALKAPHQQPSRGMLFQPCDPFAAKATDLPEPCRGLRHPHVRRSSTAHPHQAKAGQQSDQPHHPTLGQIPDLQILPAGLHIRLTHRRHARPRDQVKERQPGIRDQHHQHQKQQQQHLQRHRVSQPDGKRRPSVRTQKAGLRSQVASEAPQVPHSLVSIIEKLILLLLAPAQTVRDEPAADVAPAGHRGKIVHLVQQPLGAQLLHHSEAKGGTADAAARHCQTHRLLQCLDLRQTAVLPLRLDLLHLIETDIRASRVRITESHGVVHAHDNARKARPPAILIFSKTRQPST